MRLTVRHLLIKTYGYRLQVAVFEIDAWLSGYAEIGKNLGILVYVDPLSFALLRAVHGNDPASDMSTVSWGL